MHKSLSPWLLALFALALPAAARPTQQPGATLEAPRAEVVQEGWKLTPPTEFFDVVKVVDADTIHIQRKGELQKLRLLSVDTEETLASNSKDPDKPSTVFGEDCAKWAQEFFAKLGQDGKPARVGLVFPRDVEARDVYGRVLCYVILPDGRNFNLMLVQLGKSPYFNKYGHSELCHEAFLAAQVKARAAELGIWNPSANAPKTAGAPSAKRPYDRLLPWWDARAAAVDAYRARRASDAAHVAAADAPAELEQVFATSGKGEEVAVFGSIERLFDEDDGSLTVLLRSGAKDKAVRARIAKSARGEFEKLDLAHLSDEYRQNYVWLTGRIETGSRGFEVRCATPDSFKLAGPEPKLAKAVRANGQ